MKQGSSSTVTLAARPLVPRNASSTAMCCLIVASSAAAVVNGFVMVPLLFRSSFLSGWPTPFRPSATRNHSSGRRTAATVHPIGSRRQTSSAERYASWNMMGFDDIDQSRNSNKNNVNNNEAMRSLDDSVDEDMELLKYRIARNRALGPGIQPDQAPPSDVHIILFYPESEHEGVHTIEFPKGSGHNVILGFEDLAECVEFSKLLAEEEEHLFVEPAPRQIHLQSLEAYCATTLGGDVEVQVVPRGTHLVPPTGTVEELNHNPMAKEEHEKQTSQLERLFEMEYKEDSTPTDSTQLDSSVGAWE